MEQSQQEFKKAKSSLYYGRPSPFLSNFLFMLNPAPDNLMASNILSIFEFGMGMSLFRLGNRVKINPGLASKVKKIGAFLLAGHLMFSGGAQYLSNELNGDDTILAADAKRQRRRALAMGEPVNWWYGPKFYDYMSSKEIQFLLERAKTQTMTTLTAEGNKIVLKSEALALENDRYFKAQLRPSLLGKHAVTTIEKPPLKLDSLLSEVADDDADVNYVWFELFDPWKELWQEVNLSINFVPKWNYIETVDQGGNGYQVVDSSDEEATRLVDKEVDEGSVNSEI